MKDNDEELIHLITHTHKWINKLNTCDTDGFPKNWAQLKEVQLAHIILMNEIVSRNFDIPQFNNEKGIVIGAGGAKYFACAFSCVYILRKLGCDLPIEFWYLDEHEIDNKMKQLCDIFHIRYINANAYCVDHNIKPRILNGWELKPFSVLHSDFSQVLYLDADNIPVKNPMYLFDLPEYNALGAIFWPDLPPHKRQEWLPKICWENVGLQWRSEPDFETGQFLINKSKCYKELFLTNWMNEHSDWFYKFVYGDKSTFHLAWRKYNSEYVIPTRPAGWRRPSILQYDTAGSLIFQHACQGKEAIVSGSIPQHHKNYDLVHQASKIRSQYWSGIIYSWTEMNTDEQNIAKSYIGKYRYARVKLDSRNIQLEDNGIISEGAAKCERRWSVRIINGIPNIVVIGAAHKDSEIAMFFAKDDGSGKKFNGKWTAFEKCDISMERI